MKPALIPLEDVLVKRFDQHRRIFLDKQLRQAIGVRPDEKIAMAVKGESLVIWKLDASIPTPSEFHLIEGNVMKGLS